jgi:eukaryotic-like serine/threonine-protein kinase
VALTSGTRLGPYEIVSPLGAGGMGEVYRAMDTNLKRQVAIKVLPQTVGADPDRLARFQREAEVLAALNHPHIAHIHGLEKSDGTLALVMELVEGPTLADIAKEPIPLAEALPIAKQIAEALEAAHERGIIHRDLKPANIKVRPDGTVKVLDFGLAKAMEPAGAASGDPKNSPTLTARATQMGTIVGTAAYMAPEQAKGRPVDTRADIWAFGVVCFEMLTGKPVFAGETIGETVAAVLRDDIDWTSLPATTPDSIRHLLARCLHRDVRQRLQAIGEARIVLDSRDGWTGPSPSSVRSPLPPSRNRLILWGCAAALVAVAAAASGWLLGRAKTPSPVVTRLSVLLPVPLAPHYETANVALSRDGGTLAYVGIKNGIPSLYVRRMDEVEVRPLAGTEGAAGPVFSPDGAWVAFIADGKLKKVPVLGGSPTLVNEGNPDSIGMDWTPDGIVFTRGFTLGVARVSASGGAAQTVMVPDPGKGESSYLWPRLLPGGTDVLFVINPDTIASFNEGRIAVQTLGTKESREILDALGSFPLYAASGHLVFFSGGSVRVAPFDLRHKRMTGPAVPVVEGVSVTPHTGAVQAAISESGTLAYAPVGDQVPRSSLVVVDVNGRAQPLTDVLPHYLGEMSVSPDGQRVALRSAKANDDIHVFDIPRASLTRFTYEGGDEQNPVWTPDGKRLAYASQRGGTPAMYWKAADGNGTPEKILAPQHPQRPSSFSADGRFLAYTEVHPQSGLDIWTLRLEEHSSRQPEPFLRTPFDEDLPLFSPDGHWLAYRSNESGRMEVYVAQFPGAGVKRQISIDGGDQPMWAPDGKQLFYLNGNRVMTVDLNAESGLHPTKPRTLFERALSPSAADSGVWGHTYAVFPDGKRFLFVENAVQPEVRELRVVLNWFEELKRLVPAK